MLRSKPRARAAPRSEPALLRPRRLLLDTHVWLWWQANDSRLGVITRQLLANASEVHVSAASVWEIAIKVALGKLTLPADADVEAELSACGFLALPVQIVHANQVRSLLPLHRDPFDRLLIAQAQVEELTLVTADPALAAYGATVVDATR